MNLQRTGLFILAAAAAALLAASTLDAVPQDNAAASPAYPVPYNHPANTPADATWGSLFSAHWR